MGGWKVSKQIADISLLDLLPPSIKNDEKIAAAAQAIDVELQLVNTGLDIALVYSRVTDLAEDVLDYLAWQFHVDDWPSDLTLAMKQTKIQGALQDHFKKGTPWAVKNGVKNLGYVDVEVYESVSHWAEFDVEVETVDGGLLTPDILKSIDKNKNARSHLRDLVLVSKPESAPLGVGARLVTHIQS
jgi:phage tail P2-like protein